MKYRALSIVAIAVAMIIIIYQPCNKMKRLKNRGVVVNALIEDVSLGRRRTAVFEFNFFINGKKHSGVDIYEMHTSVKSRIIGKYVPVIVLPTKPSVYSLLLLESQFEQVNKPFPDSLRWIEGYMHYNR